MTTATQRTTAAKKWTFVLPLTEFRSKRYQKITSQSARFFLCGKKVQNGPEKNLFLTETFCFDDHYFCTLLCIYGFRPPNTITSSRPPRYEIRRSLTGIRVMSFIGCCSVLNFRTQVTTNQRRYLDLRNAKPTEWYFPGRNSEVS